MQEEVCLDILSCFLKEEIKLINLGYQSRYIYEKSDEINNFYMLGSMGLILPIALGVQLQSTQNIYALSGDGSLLMNLGSLSMINNVKGLRLLLIDNCIHNSTGGQKTQSNNVDYERLSIGSGFDIYYYVDSEYALKEVLRKITMFDSNENIFIRIMVKPLEYKPNRVELTPEDIKDRFKMAISKRMEEPKCIQL